MFILYKVGFYDYITGHISIESFKSFCEKKTEKPFVLYLRSFDTDIQTRDRWQLKRLKQGFSEYKLAKTLKNNQYDCYAVGITTELDSPYGANRIYCSFEGWKQEVHHLIERASFVYICADGRDSCIWEMNLIRQKIKQKPTIYYFTSEALYQQVSKLVSFPNLPEGQKFPCYYFYNEYTHIDNYNAFYRKIISIINDFPMHKNDFESA